MSGGWARPGPGRPPTRREQVLTEWEHARAWVSFREFAAEVGMSFEAWERMFLRARAVGDPRAVGRDSAARRDGLGRWAS